MEASTWAYVRFMRMTVQSSKLPLMLQNPSSIGSAEKVLIGTPNKMWVDPPKSEFKTKSISPEEWMGGSILVCSSAYVHPIAVFVSVLGHKK